jgi:hypothetical protein
MNERLFWFLYPTEWIAVLSLVLAGAAIVQAVIYVFMHKANKRTARAYVKMSDYRPGLTFGYVHSGGDGVSKQDVAVRVKVSNNGTTPARITRVLIQPIVAIPPLPIHPTYDESFGESFDAFLVKGDHFNVPKPMRIPRSELSTIRSFGNIVAESVRPLRLFIIGYVDYIDVFGERHRAGYGRMFNVWVESKGIQPDDPTMTETAELEKRHRLRNNLVFMEQAGYNYDRPREEGKGDDWEDSQKPPNSDS